LQIQAVLSAEIKLALRLLLAIQITSTKLPKQMKVSNRQLLLFYLTTVCLLTIYTLTSLKECEAYWMHDASITITKWKLLTDTSFFFLLPVLIIFTQKHFKIKTPTKLFLTQFFIASTSILFLLLAINKPCKNKNDGHYMFISSTMTIGYYLLKFVSLFVIVIIIIQTTILKNKATKTGQV
jgi:hypothetical protein